MKKRYKGILNEPMLLPYRGHYVGAEKQYARGQELARLFALMDHYGINPAPFDPVKGWQLALALVNDHVPGFKRIPLPRPNHRPPVLKVSVRDYTLCVEGSRAKSERRSEEAAVRALGARWRESGELSWKHETLWRYYKRLKAKIRDSGEMTPGMKAVEGYIRVIREMDGGY